MHIKLICTGFTFLLSATTAIPVQDIQSKDLSSQSHGKGEATFVPGPNQLWLGTEDGVPNSFTLYPTSSDSPDEPEESFIIDCISEDDAKAFGHGDDRLEKRKECKGKTSGVWAWKQRDFIKIFRWWLTWCRSLPWVTYAIRLSREHECSWRGIQRSLIAM